MKLFLKVMLSVLILFVLLMGGGLFFLTRGLEPGVELAINGVDLLLLDDGTYNGVYNGGRWSNEINVTVKENKIVKIDLVKDVVFAKEDVTKDIFNRVIEKQKTNVDVISGSTITCKAYLKSIENALTSAGN